MGIAPDSIPDDTTFKIHFFLILSKLTIPDFRIELDKLSEKLSMPSSIVKEHCNYLEKKLMIRYYEKIEGPKTGYELIAPGDAVIKNLWPKIDKILTDFNDPVINDYLLPCKKLIEPLKIFECVYSKASDSNGASKQNKAHRIILDTIYDQYHSYLGNLEVFDIHLDRTIIDNSQNNTIKISGNINSEFTKLKGKVPIRIRRFNHHEYDSFKDDIRFADTTISGSVIIPQNYPKGDHVLCAFFQHKGYNSPAERWKAYVLVEKALKVK